MKTLFDIEEIKPTGNTCRHCIHAQGWECGSKVIYYCEIRKSNRTDNGLLKIKLKNIACAAFKKDKI